MTSLRLSLIAIVSVLMAACGGDSSPSPMTPSPSPATASTPVSIPVGAQTLGTGAFNPNPLTVPVGTTVRWTNNDTIVHDATSNTNVWASGTLAPGSSFDFRFQNTGTFPYRCTIHPGMTGTIVVQ